MTLNYFLLVIPQNRFCEEELYDLKGVLNQGPGKCVVLSKSGKEAKGENKTILQPDGMLVDWNRHLLGKQKYDAVIVIGGKGSRSYIWEDPILPQILTDHFRASKILGAFDLSIVALARAGLISSCEVSAPKDEKCLKELELVGAYPEEKALIIVNKIITSNDTGSGKAFGEIILNLLDN